MSNYSRKRSTGNVQRERRNADNSSIFYEDLQKQGEAAAANAERARKERCEWQNLLISKYI